MKNIQANLLNHLQKLVKNRDPFFAMEGHFFVREYIRTELSNFGEVKQHNFPFQGINYQNLILDLCGDKKVQHKPPILIGAHYDTVFNSPGADDNATGIAVLLELARFFSQEIANYPLRFVAFDMEEYGLLGSTAYAQLLRQEKQPLRLMLSLEMLGYCDKSPNSQKYPTGLDLFYPNTGDFIALVGNLFTIPEMLKLKGKIRQANVNCEWLPAGIRGSIVPDTRRSDHAPFWDNGYKAIMVTDTANLRNPHYHSVSDTLDTLDLDFLTGVCQGLSLGIQAL